MNFGFKGICCPCTTEGLPGEFFFIFFYPQVSKNGGGDTQFSYIFASPDFIITAREILKTVLKSSNQYLSIKLKCDSKKLQKKFWNFWSLYGVTPLKTLQKNFHILDFVYFTCLQLSAKFGSRSCYSFREKRVWQTHFLVLRTDGRTDGRTNAILIGYCKTRFTKP